MVPIIVELGGDLIPDLLELLLADDFHRVCILWKMVLRAGWAIWHLWKVYARPLTAQANHRGD